MELEGKSTARRGSLNTVVSSSALHQGVSQVQSIVWQTLRTTTDPKAIRQSIESRLFALSRSHDLLTREKWESAGLFDIAHDALEPFGVSRGRADRIVITGENIRFPPKAALALS